MAAHRWLDGLAPAVLGCLLGSSFLRTVVGGGLVGASLAGALRGSSLRIGVIEAVPTVMLNGAPFGQGRMSIEEIVATRDKIMSGTVERFDSDVLARIVGGKVIHFCSDACREKYKG